MEGTGNSPLRAWLQELYDQHGYLTPEIVRDAARPEDSPGHLAVFGVSSDEAAEAYYLIRAHKIIQSVRIVTLHQAEKAPVTVRAYHAVPGNDERSYVYRSVDDLVRNPDQLTLARNEAKRRLNDAERSLESLDSLTPDPDRRRTRKALAGIRTAQKALAAD